MRPYFSSEFGNPGSLHSFGQKAIAAVDASRESIGKLIGAAHFREIIFTSGATEANNLALRGAVEFYKKNNPGGVDADSAATPRIIISSIEHESFSRLLGRWSEMALRSLCFRSIKRELLKLSR